MRQTLRKPLLAAAKGLGLLAGLRRLGRGPLVYFYHGVEAGPVDSALAGLQMPLDRFRRQVDFLRRRLEIISLDELRQRLASGEGLGPHQALITFDDGFANLAQTAGPLLAELRLPFAVFVNSQSIEERQRIPTYYLRTLLAQKDLRELDLPSQGQRLALGEVTARPAARERLTLLIKRAPQDRVRALLADLCAALPLERWQELDAGNPAFEPLTWKQARALQAMGATIGSHCHEHALLHQGQPRQEIAFQLARSRELIREHLGACDYLCYPNGRPADVCPEARAEAERQGYKLAFTTVAGEVRPGLDHLLLPRVSAPAERDQTMGELELQIGRRWGVNRGYERAWAGWSRAD